MMKIDPKEALAVAAASLALAAAQITLAHGEASPNLLQQASQTLRTAKAISADFEQTDTYPVPYKDLSQKGTLLLSRAGQLRVDIERYRRVDATQPWAPSGNDAVSASDGVTYTYAFLHPHSTQVRTQAASAQTGRSALAAALAVRDFFAATPEDSAWAGVSDVQTLSDETWEGANYRVVSFSIGGSDSGTSGSGKAYIGDDKLVHRLVETVQGRRGQVVHEWDLRNVVLNGPVDTARFAYAIPRDATRLPSTPPQASLQPGDVAPDFGVTTASGSTVKLSDYRGKTVVLDFWATWCWPCNQSLPHTEAVAEAPGNSDVVVLAIAVRDSKAGFDAWLAKHNYPRIHFAVDPSPQGEDIASRLYGVETTPTAFVIGPDGKIARIVSGYAGPSRELADAIDSAKPVVKAAGLQ